MSLQNELAVSGSGIALKGREGWLALWHEAAVFSLWLPMNTLSMYEATSYANVLHTHKCARARAFAD